MSSRLTRRTFLRAAPAAGLGFVAFAPSFAPGAVRAAGAPQSNTAADWAPAESMPASFPSHDVDLARRVVGLSHGKLDELRPLVEARPTLALATYDWGFGDWETAIGAASHVGRPDIAEFLMSHGARPDYFTFAMLGNLAAVRAMIEARPGLQRVRGPHGITLLQHAKNGGESAAAVVDYLESLGDADPTYRDDALSDAEKSSLLGDYAFGSGASDAFTVQEGMGGLTILRKGGNPRRLFHQGAFAFHPGGAPEVVVRFDREGDRVVRVHVVDAAIQVTATRTAG